MNNPKKKILFLIQLPPPFHGVSVMNQQIIQFKLIKQKYDFEVLSLALGQSIHQIGKLNFQKVLKSFWLGAKLIERLLLFKPDLVYFTLCPTGNAFYRDVLYVLLIKMLRVPLLFHLHGKKIKEASQNKINHFLYKVVFHKTKVIHLSSLLLKDIDSYIHKKDCYILPNGIPDFGYVKEHKNQSDQVNILFLSNMIINKGILILLEAIKNLSKTKLNFRVHFSGEWSAELSQAKFKKLLIKYKINDKVKYIGPSYDQKKVDVLSKADIFVFPTYNDCFPLVILEAMQCGLPVISTDEGAIPEIIDDGVTGFLVKQKNVEDLSEKMKLLIEDKELREKMGRSGQDKFEKCYTLKQFEKNLVAIFDDILY